MDPSAWTTRVRLGAAAGAGVALMAAFPPVGLGFVAPIALVPLLLALRGAGPRVGAAVGAVFAAAFFALLLFWISLFGVLALAVLTFGHMAYLAAFGAIASRLSGSLSGRLAGVPLVWGALEMLRARWPLGGLAWGDLGYSQVDLGPLLPLARVVGVHLLGVLIVVAAALIAEIVVERRRSRRAMIALGVLLVVGIVLPLGPAGPVIGSLSVAGVQGNVERGSFAGFGPDRERPGLSDIVTDHLDASEPLLDGPAPSLLVWPENAFGLDPDTASVLFARVQGFVQQLGSPMILPAILDEGEGFANANLLLDPSGKIVQRYDKVHLVPFGEYVPWDWARRIVPALDAEIPRNGVPGQGLVPFDVAGTRVGTLICFESTYAPLARALVRGGSEILVVTTNNASFQTSPASAQHLAMSRMRAVENGRSVAHVAISGISAMIDADGTVLERGELFERDLLRADLPLSNGQTPYTRYGGWMETLAAAAAVAFAAGRWGRGA